ncbi:MAG TPA: hypothetical protein VL979_06570 [Solirubrobacteraceae bacterium]|nr:hypothetical protein [Solirubrobacteraceae bacterium]
MGIALLRSPGAVKRAMPAVLPVVLALALAPGAQANVGEKIILRCTHGESLSGFSQADYRKALQELSADTEEYSSCSQRIREAQLAAATGGRGVGGGGGGGTATPVAKATTPAQERSLQHARSAAPATVKLGDQSVDPGVVHADIASAFSALPSPLLATLAFLLACLVAVAGLELRNRIRGHIR